MNGSNIESVIALLLGAFGCLMAFAQIVKESRDSDLVLTMTIVLMLAMLMLLFYVIKKDMPRKPPKRR